MQSNLKLADPLQEQTHCLTFPRQSRPAKQVGCEINIQQLFHDRLEGVGTGSRRSLKSTLSRDHWSDFAAVYTGLRQPYDLVRRSLDQFIVELLQRLAEEPVTDGIDHPCLDLMKFGIATYSASALERLEAIIFGRRAGPASEVLRLLARISPGSGEWRANVVRKALASPSIEIRDAAIQACESWAEKPLVTLLRSHREKVAWLNDYAQRVVRDLEE